MRFADRIAVMHQALDASGVARCCTPSPTILRWAMTAATIVADGQIRLWWDGRDGVPVDLFFPQHPFHDEVERATTLVPFENGTIPIISATHLTVFKCLYNRAGDWPDVAAMLEAGTVDTAVALDWVGTLLGEDSAPYLKLAELVVTARAGGLDAPGSEMERPRVDWKALPGS